MNNKSTISRFGGVDTILTIVFVILKLCKVINWSWLWVLSPAWIGICLVIYIAIIVAIIQTIYQNRG